MYSAILKGYPTGYQGQPPETPAALKEVFETREEARRAARKEWPTLREKWEFVGRTILIVDVTQPGYRWIAEEAEAGRKAAGMQERSV